MNMGSQQTPVPSTKPYLIRALYQWCVDNGFTPYLSVYVDRFVQVPMDYVKNDEIVLNISPDACQAFMIDNASVQFKARFGGVARDIWVPITHVMAIYSRENSQGMSFPVQIADDQQTEIPKESSTDSKEKAKSHLKLVK
jgi:stringent starvation protein B